MCSSDLDLLKRPGEIPVPLQGVHAEVEVAIEDERDAGLSHVESPEGGLRFSRA